MIKAGIIFGVLGFISSLLISLVSPICSVCVAAIFGFGAGYLAGNYDRPLTSQESLKAGVIAGALTGGLMIPGGIIAAVINAGSLQGDEGRIITEILGGQPPSPELIWALTIMVTCCLGLTNLVILSGFGAGGGAIWFNRNREPKGDEPIPPAL